MEDPIHQSPLRHDADARLAAAAYLRYKSRADSWSAERQISGSGIRALMDDPVQLKGARPHEAGFQPSNARTTERRGLLSQPAS